jgi:hypothetical protein
VQADEVRAQRAAGERSPNGPTGDPWHGANLLDPAFQQMFRADPHPFLRHLRESAPVHRTPVGLWRVTRYADCVHLLRDAKVGVRRTDGTRFDEAAAPASRPGDFMLQRDPPTHTRLRKLVSKAFTPRAVEALRPRMEAIARAALDRACERGEIDVIRDLALPVPATMICEMMGVPTADRDRFTQWTAEATHLLAALLSPPEVTRRGLAASDALAAYFEGLIALRRREPRDDLLTALVRAEEEGDRLSAQELVSQCVGLLIAGFETTIGLIGNGILALVRHPDQLARLQAEPALLPRAIEECLRFDGPIALTVRVTHEDLELGGEKIPVDSPIFVMLAAANRDPAAFDAPETFDVGRDPNPHLAFGGGTHLCLGTHLARAEAQIAIGEFVRRVAEPEVAADELAWGRSLFRVLDALPVRFRPAEVG